MDDMWLSVPALGSIISSHLVQGCMNRSVERVNIVTECYDTSALRRVDL